MKKFYFVVDKEYGSSHSFVDGMINEHILPRNKENKIYYAKRKNKACINDKYLNSAFIESRFKRQGVQRILFSFLAFACFFKNFKKNNNEVFVRNEVLVLFLFSLFKIISPNRYSLTFQSSFPHEDLGAGRIKSFIAKFLLSMSLRQVDNIYVVSSLAADRIKGYSLSSNVKVNVIPLCTEFPLKDNGSVIKNDKISFVYIGTFSELRRLDLILSVFLGLINKSNLREWHLDFFGGDSKDFINNYPDSVDMVNVLLELKLITFHGVVNRDELQNLIKKYDVGINLIPPTKIYLESSSTKLAEYLASGLPVLSNSEIPFHEYIYSKGDIGWLCLFTADSISESVLDILKVKDDVYLFKSTAGINVVRDNLRYEAYLKYF